MKFYSLKKKLWDESIKDEDDPDGLGKVYPRVNAKHIQDESARYLFRSKMINKQTIVDNAPLLDYFICYNGTYDKEYDWIKLDAYSTTGAVVPINILGFLVSERFYRLLEMSSLVLGSDHHFYPSLLRFRGDYLTYYLYQYIYDGYEQIDWTSMSAEIDGVVTNEIDINRMGDYVIAQVYDKTIKKAKYYYVFDAYSDILSIPAWGKTMISERFKNLIESNNITGFEITEIDYFDISFHNGTPE